MCVLVFLLCASILCVYMFSVLAKKKSICWNTIPYIIYIHTYINVHIYIYIYIYVCIIYISFARP